MHSEFAKIAKMTYLLPRLTPLIFLITSFHPSVYCSTNSDKIKYLPAVNGYSEQDGTSESSGSSENAGEPILVYSPSTETIEYLTTTVSGYRIPDSTSVSSGNSEITAEPMSSSTAFWEGDTCNCTDIDLRLTSFDQSSNGETSFEFILKTTYEEANDPCQSVNLTEVVIQRYGPINRVSPASSSTCTSNDIFCSLNEQLETICTVTCVFDPVAPWIPCGNYTLDIRPEYSDCKNETVVLQQFTSVVAPTTGEDIQLTITNVNASSDSFTLRWSVFPEECYSIINSYNMVLESEVGSGSSQNAQIPLDCTEKEGSEIFFGSNNCPGLFNISPCNGYHVKVKPEVTSYETLYSGAEKLTTLPPDDLKIYVYDVNAGSRWISFNWNMSETACVFALSRLMLRVTDTYSENTVSFALPKNCSDQSNIADTQNCFANITSTMRLTEQESVLPCTLYDIVVFPQIGGIDYTQNKTSFTAKTTPDGNTTLTIYNVQPGAEWISFGWNFSEPRCERALTGLELIVVDKSQSNQGVAAVDVPRNCSGCNNSLYHSSCSLNTTNNSEGCPSVPVSSCSHYQVSLYPKIWDVPYRQFIGANAAKTTPGNDLILNIYDVQSGSQWISLGWNLSEPRCEYALTGLNLKVTDLGQNNQDIAVVDVPKSCSGCNNSLYRSSCSLNITKNSEGCPSVPVVACSHYQITLYPKIWDVPYRQFTATNSAKTTPDKSLTVNAYDISSGSEWISFRWNLSDPRCMIALTGSRLNITDENHSSSVEDLNQFCSGCGGEWNAPLNTHGCLMNTSTNEGCPTFHLLPCVDYKIRLFPKIWDVTYEPLDSLVESTTIADENLRAVVDENSLSSGPSWISFQWQASTETCRKKIGSYLVSENLPDRPFFSCPTGSSDTVTFNTSLDCFKQNIYSCGDYSLSVSFEMDGKVVGKPTVVNRTTLFDDLIPFIYPNSSHGLDWFSFQWELSDHNCTKYISSYSLNVTEFFNKTEEIRSLNITDCLEPATQDLFVFNSSCPNANLSIVRCSSYMVTVLPSLSINNELLKSSPSPFSELETSSGDWGNIEDPIVKSREANAITLEWTEPKCRYSDGIKSYNIALTSAWDGLFGDQEEFEVVVIPGCLERLSDRRVSVTLNETMCNAQSVMFRSCSPYQFTVLPEFVVASANENVEGWSQGTSTNPLDKDLGVNLAVEDKGSRWFLLSWDQPKCRSPVTMWTLLDNFLNQSISIPPDCPLQENNLENETSRKLLLNVSDTLACDQNAQGLPILPCSWHGFTLKVELNKIDGIFSTENGTTSASSLSEDPGNVTDVEWDSAINKINIEWSPPKENPQCVLGYRVEWGRETKELNQTSIAIENLEACSNFSVKITALSETPALNGNEVNVATQFIEPGLVDSSSILFDFHNESVGRLTWDKPREEVDDCITGYLIEILETDSEGLTYSKALSGKHSTEVNLFEGDFQPEKGYTALITSRCSFSGSSSESVAKPFSWNSSSGMRNTASMIVPTIICTISLAICIGLLLIFRRKRDQEETHEPSVDFPVVRKPTQIEEFNQMLAFLEADSGYELSKEYEELKKFSAINTYEAAKKEENQEKNRYLDILPYDHSRVKLRAVCLDETQRSDYINASFITGFGKIPRYIAAQGPKPSTIEDFWRMCMEQEVRVIVALTALEERGRIKCAQYWPSEGALEYGYIRVELLSTTLKNSFIQRKFSVTVNGERASARIISQLHFTIWPDFGCPDRPESLLELVYAMRQENSFTNLSGSATPIVVHCSAGVGRTGTLIALDLLMKQAKQQRAVEVLGTARRIRQDRAKMIQNEDQYRFLYRCLGHYIDRELLRPSLAT